MLGWTQREVAERLCWDEETVRRYERGERQPTGKRLCSLMTFLDETATTQPLYRHEKRFSF